VGLLVCTTLCSLASFVWLHVHFVGPNYANECLVTSIEGAIHAGGGLAGVDMLRVRVMPVETSVPSAVADLVRGALVRALAAERHSPEGGATGRGAAGRRALRVACAAATSTCTWAEEDALPLPLSDLRTAARRTAIADKLATHSLSSRRAQAGRVRAAPDDEVLTITLAMLEDAGMTNDAREGVRAGWSASVQGHSPYPGLTAAIASSRLLKKRGDNSASAIASEVLQMVSEFAGRAEGTLRWAAGKLLRTCEGDRAVGEGVEQGINGTWTLSASKPPFWMDEHEADALYRSLVLGSLRRSESQQGSDGYAELLLALLLEGGPGMGGSPVRSYTFATDKGMLTLGAQRRDGLRVQRVEVDIAASSACFGGPSTRWLLSTVAGYDVPILNGFAGALLRLSQEGTMRGGEAPLKGSSAPLWPVVPGWLSVDHRDEVHALSEATEVAARFSLSHSGIVAFTMLKLGTLCSAVFLLFATSSLVSFILAQSQQRMLRFTMTLQSYVRARLPLGPLLAAHMVDSLIFVPIILGVMFFMFSFFADQLLAFLVMLAVWVCEVQNIIGCRTEASLRVFPKVFGLLMTWFHAYYLAFPFGFAYPAFFTACWGLLTAGFDLWNTYELPAILDESLTSAVPRAPAVTGIMLGPWAGPAGLLAAGEGAAGAPVLAEAAASHGNAADGAARDRMASAGAPPALRHEADAPAASASATSPVSPPRQSPRGAPLSPARWTPALTSTGLATASSPFSATYRSASLSESSFAGMAPNPLARPTPLGVGVEAAAEAATVGGGGWTGDDAPRWGRHDVTLPPPAIALEDASTGGSVLSAFGTLFEAVRVAAADSVVDPERFGLPRRRGARLRTRTGSAASDCPDSRTA